MILSPSGMMLFKKININNKIIKIITHCVKKIYGSLNNFLRLFTVCLDSHL